MKLLTIFSAVATSAAFAAASPTPSHKDDVQLVARASVGENDQTSNAHCERQTYRIKSSANRTEFDLDKMLPQTNQSRITELFVEYVTNMPQFMSDYVKGKQQHSHTFDISGILCKPKNNADDSRAIQLLVHGIGYDSRYWNLYADGVPEKKYSYVYQAAEQGITTFRYDRLGTGESYRPRQGYNVAQGSTEVGILQTFAQMLKNTNKIGGQKWDKTLLIGHSYGSAQSQALTSMDPSAVDGVILTGFTSNTTGTPFYLLSTVYTQANMVFPDRFEDIPEDWLVTATPYSAQQNFLHPSHVTSAAVTYNRAIEQPVTQGGLFTIGGLAAPAPQFKGPVLVLTGQKDFIFTFDNPEVGNTTLAAKTAEMLYPASSNATSSSPPSTGHAINVHTTAHSIYHTMLEFAKTNNL